VTATVGSAENRTWDSPELLPPEQLVDGEWSTPETDGGAPLSDPITEEPLQPRVATPLAEVRRAVAAAWRDHRRDPGGIGTAGQRRAALLEAADRLDAMTDEIAAQESLTSAVPIAVTRLFAGSLGATLRSAAGRIPAIAPEDLGADGRSVLLHRLPLGPAAVIAPWNAPTAVAAKKTAYAWAAGCPVVLKPSPWTPNGTVLLVRALREAARSAGLQPVAVQLVFGDAEVGQALVSDPRVRAVSFTGSRAAGRAVAAAAAGGLAATQLELGSNNPAVVLADADLRDAAGHLARGMTKLNGAWCEGPGTVFVPGGLRDRLVDELIAHLGSERMGHPLDPDVSFGPQSNPAQWTGLRQRLDQLRESGARLVDVGEPPLPGRWIVPTLAIEPSPESSRAEVFGPVLIVRTYNDLDDAVDEAHLLETGLAGYVFSTSPAAAHDVGRRLPAGEVKINGTSLLDMSDRSAQTFWYGSGVGGHGDDELLRFFTGARIVGQDVDSAI
jgi:betaine-aldehyde dehydrogenase